MSMPKINLILIALIVLIIGAVGLTVYFTWPSEEEITKQPGTKPAELPAASSKVPTPQEMGAGDVGEVMVEDERTGEEKALVNISIPPAIFNAVGTISEVKSDRLIIQGDGTNFADKTPRTLVAIFTDSTLTFEKNQTVRYSGKEGLNHLKVGMKIIIDSAENIRGRTEFTANTINIL